MADGIIVTAAAGNDRRDFKKQHYNSCKVYPTSYYGVLNAAATDMDDNALMGEFDDGVLIMHQHGMMCGCVCSQLKHFQK